MPRILYFAPEDWAFVSHFLPMAQAARACGFEVVIATRINRHGAALIGEGYKLVALKGERGRLSPWRLLKSFREMAQIVRAEQPTIVHCISFQMAVLGGLAARTVSGPPGIVLSLTGLGYGWVESGVVAAMVRAVVRAAVGFLLWPGGTICVFENAEDPRELGLDPAGSEVVLAGGAGVDPAAFPSSPEPTAPPVKVALLARMIRSKGIAEAVAAVSRARELGANIELSLLGAPDPSNRASLTEADLQRLASEPGIHWRGHVDDVPGVFKEHHIAILLSVREGLPKCLVEAAAAGRPIVATDVPGCREVVRQGREGYLVRFGDIEAAARALVQLAGDPALRQRLGKAANARFRERFTVAAVKGVFEDLYHRMMTAAER
jgi:glycosyltransferase involved in cell wall biosynthesis